MTATLEDLSGLFEIHITISKPQSAEIEQEILQRLGYFPIKFIDYFQNVINVEPRAGDPPHPKGTPSAAQLPDGEEGHDIAKPWVMFTMVNPDYGNVRKTGIDALEILAEYEAHGVRRTIEVEKFISEKVPDSRVKLADYKGHKKACIAPLYENHVQFEGTLKELPPYHGIISLIQDKCNVTRGCCKIKISQIPF